MFCIEKIEHILFLNSLFGNGLLIFKKIDTTMNDILLTFFEWQM